MLGEGPRIGPRDRSRISWAVLAMVALVALAAPVSSKGLSASSGCIHSGGEVRIQSVLHGRGARAVLCQHAKFVLSHTIRFTAPEQRIYTNAFPRDDARATLTLTNSMDSTAVSGADQTGVQLTNVIVDGGNGQPNQPALRDGPQPLVLMGGTGSDQRLEWVTSRDPRGWSTFQCFQPGPRAVVRHNTFGPGQPIGDHWPYEDTTPVSDGISFGCNNGKVSDNRIINVNDVGIALFSPIGSVIEHNTIIASDRAVGAGIALVDPVPNFGNFTGVMVRDNIIDAAGAPIIQGLAVGPRVTCFVAPGAHTFIEDGQAGQPDSIYGGTIRGNTLRGEHMGYGYVVSGVRDFTIADNRDNSVHSGTPWPETFPDPGGSWTCPPPDPPAGFQFDAEHTATTNLQAEFQSARVEGSGNLCHPGDLNDDGRSITQTSPVWNRWWPTPTTPSSAAVISTVTESLTNTMSPSSPRCSAPGSNNRYRASDPDRDKDDDERSADSTRWRWRQAARRARSTSWFSWPSGVRASDPLPRTRQRQEER